MNLQKQQPPGPMAVGTEGQEQTKGSTVILMDTDGDGKSFATLAARAALSGAMLHRLASGGYVLTGRNAWSRELPDLRAVAELMSRIDGRRSA